MFISNENLFLPIIKSSGGLHLSIYFKNEYSLIDLKKELRSNLKEAHKLITPVMKKNEIDIFLAPIQKLIDDIQYFKKFKGNIGIFLTNNFFKVIDIPIGIESICVVSTSFHVKPLLKCLQFDRDFIFLGFGEGSVSLYKGNFHTMSFVDTIFFPEAQKILSDKNEIDSWKIVKTKRVISLGTADWLDDWVNALTFGSKPTLFLAGNKELTDLFIKDANYKLIRKKVIRDVFFEDLEKEIFNKIKEVLKEEVRINNSKNIEEMLLAEEMNLTNGNLFQISKAAVLGNVRKLFIADDVNIFGILNRTTGSLILHSDQKNHIDDDVLDDLAQEVLSRGGEVILVSRDDIPNKCPVIAIFQSGTLNAPENLYVERVEL
jgi:hypothetical protein